MTGRCGGPDDGKKKGKGDGTKAQGDRESALCSVEVREIPAYDIREVYQVCNN
jgi:hypothetical protein